MSHASKSALSPTGPVVLTCKDGFTPCQKKQMKAKAAEMDKIAKKSGGLTALGREDLTREEGDAWAAKFARDWDNPNAKGWPSYSDPSTQKKLFYDKCAETDDPLGAKMQADHRLELQLMGDPRGPFKWLDGKVNGSSGSQISAARRRGRTKITGFSTANC